MQKHEREGALDAKTNPLFCIRRGGPAGKNKTPFSHLKGGGFGCENTLFASKGGGFGCENKPPFCIGRGGDCGCKNKSLCI